MKDNKKIIGIIALSALKGIGPAFVKKVVSNSTFENGNLIQEIKDITTANNKAFDDDTIYEAVETAKEILIYFTIKLFASLEQESRMKML